MVDTLLALLQNRVSLTPSAVFLCSATQVLTYENVYLAARQRAQFLADHGIGHGDRVFIVDEDPMQTVLWMFGCLFRGAVFVVLHRDTSSRRMKMLIADATPGCVLDFGRGREDAYDEVDGPIAIVKQPDAADSLLPLPDWQVPDVIGTDLAMLVYTSGSTGNPKGILCPHRNVLAAVQSIHTYLQHTAADRIGVLLPLSFDYGLYQVFLALQAGASVRFLGDFRSPLELLTLLKQHRITGFPALRAVLVSLARLNPSDCVLKDLRYISNTGDALPSSLIEKISSNFSDVALFSMYGLSECKRALYMQPERLLQKPHSVGRPIPGTRAFLLSEAGELVPQGEIGELVLEGPHVMAGYWQAPEATKAKFLFGPTGQPRLRSGDLFFQDEEGDFHFVARQSDLIKSRGFRISPREVEAALLAANPAVRECVVYAVDDELLGQAICADVTVEDPSCTIPMIFARCREMMDEHLVPTRVRIVDVLAKTASGKYDRRAVGNAP